VLGVPSAQFLAIALALAPLNSKQPANGPHSGSFTCPVTTPNGQQYGDQPEGGNHGNEFLVTGLWPYGKVIFEPGGPGSVLKDGSLEMKFWWWRRVKGQLTFEGRRLDGPQLHSAPMSRKGTARVAFKRLASSSRCQGVGK
jgi:hypothetical protein